jgi:hypothetical protein
MAAEQVEAKYQVKDEHGNAVMDTDAEGKQTPLYNGASVSYDFGDDLDAAVSLCGAEAVFSNYVANAKVALQGIVRAKLKAGMTTEGIQELVNAWKPGMVMAKTQVNPEEALMAAFPTWSAEKQQAFLAKLGV